MTSWMEDARRLWPLVKRYLPLEPERDPTEGGRPRIANERVFYRLVLFLRAGCSWETFDLMSRGSGVSGRTCRDRLAAWRRAGAFEQVCELLRTELPTPDIAHMDATFVRARYSGDDVGLTRHGKGSKIQVIVDEHSRPIAVHLGAAGPGEARTAVELLGLVNEMPDIVVADKAYDSDDLRDVFDHLDSTLLAPHRARRVRPPRDQDQIGRHYKERWKVERFFAWLAPWRRLATRWEADVLNYNNWLCLGVSLIYIRTRFLP